MTWISEDPWPLAVVLASAAAVALALLLITRRGAYLIAVGACIALTAAVFVVEAAWVTDEEAVQAVVEDMADAVREDDPDRLIGHLAEGGLDVRLGPITRLGGAVMGRLPEGARRLAEAAERVAVEQQIRSTLERYKVDMLGITDWRLLEAGSRTGRGRAEFVVVARGRDSEGGAGGTIKLAWSLGLRKVGEEWKVDRIESLGVPESP